MPDRHALQSDFGPRTFESQPVQRPIAAEHLRAGTAPRGEQICDACGVINHGELSDEDADDLLNGRKRDVFVVCNSVRHTKYQTSPALPRPDLRLQIRMVAWACDGAARGRFRLMVEEALDRGETVSGLAFYHVAGQASPEHQQKPQKGDLGTEGFHDPHGWPWAGSPGSSPGRSVEPVDHPPGSAPVWARLAGVAEFQLRPPGFGGSECPRKKR